MLLEDILTEGEMTRPEALELLGLGIDYRPDDVTQHHRRLIMKNHPDRGGSTEMASKLNKARDLLLNNRFVPHDNDPKPRSKHDIFMDKLRDIGAKEHRRNVYILPIATDFLHISSTGFGHQPLWEIKLGKRGDGALLGVFDSSSHTLNLLKKARDLDVYEVEQFLKRNRIGIDEVV